MKVLFSNPPWWEKSELRNGFIPVRRAGVRAGSRWPFTYQTFSFPGWRAPFEYLPMPFFMTFAAAYVKEKSGADVTMRDSIARRESYSSFYDHVRESNYDYLFIESATPSWNHDKKVIKIIHEISPKTRVVVCGPITATDTNAIIHDLQVHACIMGEYEKGALEVVNGKSGVLTHNLLTTEEMNEAPWPIYDEVAARSYYDRNPRGIVMPQAQIWGSRGCPFKCIFCVWPATMTGNDPKGTDPRRVRYYAAEKLEPFIRHIVQKYGYRSIYFDDDTFNLGTKHTVEMCEMMKRIGLPWSAMCRADTIRMDIWQQMKDSGCYGVKLGFESGNQYVVDKIVNKELNLEYAREVVTHLQSIGMTVHGTFTIGLPGETPAQMQQTIDFAKSLKLDSQQISGTAEIEGTPLSELRKSGKLDAFEAATMDGNYKHATDGNKKWQLLVEELQKS